MRSADWLADLTVARNNVPLRKTSQPDPARVRMLHLQAQRRRRQGEKIKDWLSKSPASKVIPKLLGEMQRALGVHLSLYSLENPGWRLVWEVTFNYEAPWSCCYFIVRRLFAGHELDPRGSHCLGPAWEAPDTLLDYTDEELTQLLSREEIQVCSAAGTRRIRVRDPGWTAQLREALRDAYQHPFRRGSAP
jgi:hypothetical protein